MPRVIDDLYCGMLDNDGEYDGEYFHILRCDYDIITQPSTPNHLEDFAIECSKYCCVWSQTPLGGSLAKSATTTKNVNRSHSHC